MAIMAGARRIVHEFAKKFDFANGYVIMNQIIQRTRTIQPYIALRRLCSYVYMVSMIISLLLVFYLSIKLIIIDHLIS